MAFERSVNVTSLQSTCAWRRTLPAQEWDNIASLPLNVVSVYVLCAYYVTTTMPLRGTQPVGNRSGPWTPGTAPGARMTPSLARRCWSEWAGPRARWVLGGPHPHTPHPHTPQPLCPQTDCLRSDPSWRGCKHGYILAFLPLWRAWAEVGKAPLSTSKSEWKMTAMVLEPMPLMRWDLIRQLTRTRKQQRLGKCSMCTDCVTINPL